MLTVLTEIPFAFDPEELARADGVNGGPALEALRGIAAAARDLARPKAAFRSAWIGERGEDYIVVEGIRFTSRILRVNTEGAFKVLPYLATCGTELMEWSGKLADPLERYWADRIMEAALRAACRALEERLHLELPGKSASMNPGSLPDWPLEEQRALFALLPEAERTIGVRLTESCLMLPRQSVSGLRFPTEADYENCQLCPRENCPGRRAPYDESLYERRYKPGS